MKGAAIRAASESRAADFAQQCIYARDLGGRYETKNINYINFRSFLTSKPSIIFICIFFRIKQEIRLIVLFAGSPKAYIKNTETQIDLYNIKVQPYIKDGRTLLPVRFVCEGLGASLEYNSLESKISINYSDKKIEIIIGQKEMLVNGKTIILDVPAQIENERTFIPVRPLVEALGKSVFWDNRGLIIISDEPQVFKESEDNYIKEIINKFNVRGNSIGNISNDVRFTRQGEWLYFSAWDKKEFKLYKSRLDNSEKTSITSGLFHYINVVDEWIYGTLIDVSDNWKEKSLGICKIKLDGSAKIKLCDDYGKYINVVGDRIFYVNSDDGLKPYKMDLDGNNRIRINDYPMKYMNVIDDWIYFQNEIEDCKIYKMKTDGSQMQKLSSHGDYSTKLNVSGDYAYYTASYYDEKQKFVCGLYRVGIDGNSEQKLEDGVISDLYVIDDLVYYTTFQEAIYRMKIDGSDKQKLADLNTSGISIKDDWIYYSVFGEGEEHTNIKNYRVKTDGSKTELLN